MLVLNWAEIWSTLDGFALFLFGMVVYCIFVFSFYKQVSRRLIFEFSERDIAGSRHPGWAKFWSRLTYVFKYIFVVPVFLFGWFTVIAFLVLLMAEETTLDVALLTGVSLLATIRICAYYSEELAIDVAKILPLALLAIFVVDMNTINLPVFWEKVKLAPTFASTFALYFVVTVLLELVLRVYDAIANRE